MMAKYTPSFLVQAKVMPEEEELALANNMTPEELCRKAIKFFAARCVHTPKRRPAKSERKG